MNSNNYTLDRYEAEYAIFLKRPEEVEQLLIHRTEVPEHITEGAIVAIEDNGLHYSFQLLANETDSAKHRVNDLLTKLQQKQK